MLCPVWTLPNFVLDILFVNVLQEIISGAGHTSAVDWWALGNLFDRYSLKLQEMASCANYLLYGFSNFRYMLLMLAEFLSILIFVLLV